MNADLPSEPPGPESHRAQHAAFAGLLPPSLPQHPVWTTIAPRLGVEHGVVLSSGARHRPIELSTAGMSLEEVEELSRSVRIACAVCRHAIHPIRRRSRNRAGRLELLKTCFVALTCSLRESPGCSRSKPASEATKALVAAIAKYRSEHGGGNGAPPAAPSPEPAPAPPKPSVPAAGHAAERAKQDEWNQVGLRGVW